MSLASGRIERGIGRNSGNGPPGRLNKLNDESNIEKANDDSDYKGAQGLTKQDRISFLKDEQRRIMRETLRESYSSVETGNTITSEMIKQQEQLERIEQKVDETEYELKVSDKIVKSMSGLTGMVASWFTRTPKGPEHPKKQHDYKPIIEGDKKRNDSGRTQQISSSVTLEQTNANLRSGEDREYDVILDELDNNINQIKQQTVQHQTLLAIDNDKLNKISEKVERTHLHMRKTETNMKKV